jgi:uncharacterized protein (TIGR02246 family)
MPTTTTPTRDDAPIRACMDAVAHAFRAKDLTALMAHYAPDTVTFDVRPPLQVQGVGAYRATFEAWFAATQGPIDYELRDVRIATSDDVAFGHYLVHVKSTRTTGESAEYWVRVTSGFQKLNGRWLVTHEHVSVPIKMETMRAALDLQP